MEHTSWWHKQSPDKPLFPDIIWNRPENKNFAGKLLIIGGNLHGFNAPAEAYSEALKAGIGVARVLLPDALSKTVSKVFPEAEFAPSTPIGSFSQQALGEVMAASEWADGVLLAGDFGRNSETAILLERFAEEYTSQLTLTKDAADYFAKSPQTLLQRKDTTLVISLSQLQQIAMNARLPAPVTFSMGLLQLVDMLHEFTTQFAVSIVTQHVDNLFVAANGEVSTTKLTEPQKVWRVRTAAHASTWWLQNPQKPFEALTTSIVA